MAYAIKAAIADLDAPAYAFEAQKTMYGGKAIAPGDALFLFSSENSGGAGLFARGIVTSARNLPRKPGIERQTPLVSLAVRIEARAVARLGRVELRTFRDWRDGRPETELNFKFYRQATDKIVGLSAPAAAFLDRFFPTDRDPAPVAAPPPKISRR